MTWQRIDNDTYIDDTLVTFAEYQLFIDEMLEQGKYYQPDHWVSYKYPAGQSFTPAIGVRFEDVEVFCVWLKEHDTKQEEWLYRLPTSTETDMRPLKQAVKSPLGYWATQQNSRYCFVWVGSNSKNPRAIDKDHVINLALRRSQKSGFILRKEYDKALRTSMQSDFDTALESAMDRALGKKTTRNDRIASALEIARCRAIYFDKGSINETSPIRIALDQILRVGEYDFAGGLDVYNAVGSSLNLYLELFTLQERIAGRSPAFEGIRLVKERIR